MKNKILALLMTVVLCIGIITFVYAEEGTGIYILPDGGNGAITVSGEITGAVYGDSLLVLRFINLGADLESAEDDTELFRDVTNTYRENEVVKYKFDKLYLPDSLDTATYKIIISGEDLSTPLTTEYKYYNPYDVRDAIEVLSLAAEADIYDTLASKIDVLGMDRSLFATVQEDGKASFSALMKNEADYSGQASEDDERAIVIAANQTILTRIEPVYNRAIAAARFISLKNSDGVNNWLTEYYTELGFDDSAEENSITSLLNKVKNTTDFINRIVNATGEMSIEQIKTHIYESALLATIKERSDTDVAKMFNTHSMYFPNIDIVGFSKLSDVDQSRVIEYISDNSYPSIADTVKAFNGKVDEIANPDPDDDDDDSYRGGGGFRVPSVIETPTEKPTDTSTDDRVFNDIDGVLWASDAIEYLYEKGIVNGKASGVFAPNDEVTRAEFIKMVVEALGLDKSDVDMPFGDVAADSWYASYVKAAYKAGVVNGDDNGLFNPEATITREDMVTILYRAMGENSKDAELNFTDEETISDYAKEAVAHFAKAGIVNGMGDGRFGARESATRAQTAVIIYRIIK